MEPDILKFNIKKEGTIIKRTEIAKKLSHTQMGLQKPFSQIIAYKQITMQAYIHLSVTEICTDTDIIVLSIHHILVFTVSTS